MASQQIDSFMDYAPMPMGILDKSLRFVRLNRAMAEVMPSVTKQIRPFLWKVMSTGEPAVAKIVGDVTASSDAAQGWLAACFPCGESQIALMALKATRQSERETLERSNEQLRTALADLQQSLRVNEMAHGLHAALTTEELCRLAERFVPRLFPGNSGALRVMDASGEVVERTATWGDRSSVELVRTPGDCFALRAGWNPLGDNELARICSHGPEERQHTQICVPLVIQSTRLGVLHLAGRGDPPAPFAPNELRLVQTVAAEIALSLANLQSRENLRQQALRDPLTGLYNRRFLHEALDIELHRAKRKDWAVGLVMIDVDNFKSFNDTYGHAAGDSLIRTVAASLQSSVRSNDVLCRYGGDEFCLVMPETSLEDVILWADRRRSAAQLLRFEWEGRTLPFPTVSMGVAAYPACRTSEVLFREADSALYAAKRNGRDQLESKSCK